MPEINPQEEDKPQTDEEILEEAVEVSQAEDLKDKVVTEEKDSEEKDLDKEVDTPKESNSADFDVECNEKYETLT